MILTGSVSLRPSESAQRLRPRVPATRKGGVATRIDDSDRPVVQTRIIRADPPPRVPTPVTRTVRRAGSVTVASESVRVAEQLEQ
jgi:hypothetical protein